MLEAFHDGDKRRQTLYFPSDMLDAIEKSDGSRAGYIQKFSHKGWICKTYEGELAMTTVPGVAPVLWAFSIWDEKVASQLSQAMGKRLVLHYKEYRYLPTTCFGETAYFVDRVELTE